MENRLFLLEDPVESVPTGLTANILADVDVTPEKEYSGKITLTQLNAYSGELKAEALTNFKTIKIEKDGSESFTNVAKLLLELQQGGGADDAREEADIAIASAEGDSDLRLQLIDVRTLVENHHDKYEAVELAGYDLAVATPYSHKGWRPSQEADGVRTRFAAEDGMTRAGETFIVVLNGVVVTDEDGMNIMSENGPYAIGFEFHVAPSVGDIVEFYIGSIIGKASRPYEEVNTENQAAEDAAITEYNAWEAERLGEIDNFDTSITDAQQDRAEVDAEVARLKDELEDLRRQYDEAESVDLINKYAKGIKNILPQLTDVMGESSALFSEINRLQSKKFDAETSLADGDSARKEAVKAFDASKAQNEATIVMFGLIADESKGIADGNVPS